MSLQELDNLNNEEAVEIFKKEIDGETKQNPGKVCLDSDNVEQGLAKLVLTVIELLRKLLEKQSMRRIDNGTVSDEEIERLGTTFMKLDEKMEELREVFNLKKSDLNLDLGPLGKLL